MKVIKRIYKDILGALCFLIVLIVINACKKTTKDPVETENPPQEKPFAFVHPGLLHTQKDFDRMKAKVAAGAQPWKAGWEVLIANSHASLNYKPNPTVKIIRGGGTIEEPMGDNYTRAYNDAAAAYQLALRWKISGDDAYAAKTVEILNAWATTCTGISGDSNAYLASGLYGYQFANAAEIVRSYSGWSAADFTKFKNFMVEVFYKRSLDFLTRHNGTCSSHYWTNWDACNMSTVLAIGVLCDDQDMFNKAVTYFKSGIGMGNINNAVYVIFPGNLGQGQESGRDQGHATLNISLLGAFCQMACNQQEDLFAYSGSRFLALCEYTAKYNLGEDVPYTPYRNCENTYQTVVSPDGRGAIRPCWELVYNHYVNVKGLQAPYSKRFAEKVRPEGGGGNYGGNSGGFDQLGFGTLTTTMDPVTP
ncbi:MAG TPA: alginate lyase family protein [Pedobacter sp.]|uniref:alginate lyase family protein n=1 Tax=Pedobacter sp. TaxID=1411316 RepID=UPI002C22A2E1|nr:alginate lyase family protein [Pedobacter sp.]HMI02805.1 alginate lyase family protein [Pedobacter sp.]